MKSELLMCETVSNESYFRHSTSPKCTVFNQPKQLSYFITFSMLNDTIRMLRKITPERCIYTQILINIFEVSVQCSSTDVAEVGNF